MQLLGRLGHAGLTASVPKGNPAVGQGLRPPTRTVNIARHAIQHPPGAIPGAVMDDKSVPEGHKGLHGFLYGEGGAEEHDAVGSYELRRGEDEGTAVMPVAAYLESRDGDKPLGTYLVYDSSLKPQYVSYSRNMVLAIKGHLARVGPQRCAFVRAMVFGNKAMSSRANLERGVDMWVRELLGGVLPPANTDPGQRAEWEGTTGSAASAASSVDAEYSGQGAVGVGPAQLDTSHMSAAEAAAYEEKRLKMRKAMGEKVQLPGGQTGPGDHNHKHDEGSDDEDSVEVRRAKLMKAMDRGDWSAVVSQQTQEALEGQGEAGSGASTDAAQAASTSGSAPSASGSGSSSSSGTSGGGITSSAPIASPFTSGGRGEKSVASLSSVRSVDMEGKQVPLTPAAIEAALEEVRPYLLADGGDVEVVDVVDGTVYLRLQGACSSCPSQSATMKGGIERAILQAFPGQIRDVVQLDATDPGANVERVDGSLNMLRGAISNWGGAVEVVSVEAGVAVLRYKGPPAIAKGVQGAVKESFHDLREVRMVDWETGEPLVMKANPWQAPQQQ